METRMAGKTFGGRSMEEMRVETFVKANTVLMSPAQVKTAHKKHMSSKGEAPPCTNEKRQDLEKPPWRFDKWTSSNVARAADFGTEPNQTCPTCKSARFNILKLGRQHTRTAPSWSKPRPSARQIGRKDVDGLTCSRTLESKTHKTSPRGNERTQEQQSCRKARGDRQRPMWAREGSSSSSWGIASKHSMRLVSNDEKKASVGKTLAQAGWNSRILTWTETEEFSTALDIEQLPSAGMAAGMAK